MRAEDVLVAVPTRGQVGVLTVRAVQEQRDTTPGLPPVLFAQGHLSAAATRNIIVRAFLDSPQRVLVMVDDDVIPYFPLLELAERTEGEYGIVAAAVPLFNPGVTPLPLFPAAMRHDGHGYKAVRFCEQPGLMEVDAVGTGCVAVRRDVLETLGMPAFSDRLTPEGDALETTEDIVFCERAREHGYRVAVDLSLSADHIRTQSLNHLLNSLYSAATT